MTEYLVAAKATLLIHYKVEADSPEEAMANYRSGEDLGPDDCYLEQQPTSAELFSDSVFA